MKVLVIGSGGREHALCWKLAQSRKVDEVFAVPGNPGIALEPKVTCVTLSAGDFEAIAKLCRDRRVELVVVGPDQQLADGAVDFFEEEGIAAFGPVKACARIESSKAFAKDLMKKAGIPTARYETFGDLAPAREFLRTVEWGEGWVIKADGLALGKGVVVCENREEALATIENFMSGDAVGEAGRRVVIEERLHGREVSAFYLCDGKTAAPLGYACDYKRIRDGDEGPNTGGMGAFSPADWLPSGTAERVEREVVRPLLATLPFKGMLFVGLMITPQGPKVIEFNARFGDPETQALLPLLNEDLLPWLQASRDGRLHEMPAAGPQHKPLASVHIVMAAAGYPGKPEKGVKISVPEELLPQRWDREEGEELRVKEEERMAKLFFAGVARSREMNFVTNGGRVLGLTALAETRAEARRKAYEIFSTVHFSGAQRRGDVGTP